jgi:hypothetical protein
MALSNVTVSPMNVTVQPWLGGIYSTTATGLLRDACKGEYNTCKTVIQSSFDGIATEQIYPSHNGFVTAAVTAYGQHHHLTIRPEDVWFSILAQLGFYINAHAEDLRTVFVSHEGKEPLRVDEVGTLETVDIGGMAVAMTAEMEKHIVDPDLLGWIMPNFTTTTSNDIVVASVLMMGAMQEYFEYTFGIDCGLPSVTLLGEKQDWINLRKRVDKIGSLGDEPSQFASLLKPVLDHFILSFDDPKAPAVLDFWSRIAHRAEPYCGAEFLSGWITSFCFWKSDGELLYTPNKIGSAFHETHNKPFNTSKGAAEIDWERFHSVNFKNIPDGYVSVPVLIDNHGVEIKSRMVAGSVGFKVWSSGNPLEDYHRANPRSLLYGDDSLQPASGWWIYEVLEGMGRNGLNGKTENQKAFQDEEPDIYGSGWS